MSDFGDGDIFDGLGTVPSDTFIRSIRRRVLAQGVQNDDQLVAQIAASCLGGPALDWYEDQVDEVQESWKLLRRAILVRWPSKAEPVTHSSPVPSPAAAFKVPTPAAAPAAAPPRPRSSSTISGIGGGQDSKTGRIRIVSEERKPLGYISLVLNKYGHHYVVQDVASALLVQATRDSRLHDIRIVNASADTEIRMLGMTWGWLKTNKTTLSDALGSNETTWGGLVTLFGPPHSPSAKSSSTHFSGDSGSAMWSVTSDGTILTTWEYKPGHRIDLANVMGAKSGTLSFTNNYADYAKADPSAWKDVSFVFEAVS